MTYITSLLSTWQKKGDTLPNYSLNHDPRQCETLSNKVRQWTKRSSGKLFGKDIISFKKEMVKLLNFRDFVL